MIKGNMKGLNYTHSAQLIDEDTTRTVITLFTLKSGVTSRNCNDVVVMEKKEGKQN